MFVLVYFVLAFVSVFAKNEFYIGHRVYNVKLTTQEQQDQFYLLKSDIVDYWRKPNFKHNVTGRAMVPPSHYLWFEEKLQELDIEKDIYIEDVYNYLKDKESKTQSPRNDESRDFDFTGYYRYYQVLEYMRTFEEDYANSTDIKVSYVEAGITDEGRPLVYLEITNNDGNEDKPIAIVEAAIIPREWVTVSAALNIAREVVDQRELLAGLKWIIIPVLNPDGYEYTHTNLRLWSKTRSTRSNLGFICPGVNINRNFGFDWLFSDSSSSPCSHLYGGIEPFSEPETRIIQTLVEENGTRIKMYISLQNGGGYIAYPWQYERAASGMFRQHHLLGREMRSILGEDYILDIGSLAAGDRASGTSTDYVMDHDVMYTFSINIEGQGDDGVIVPETDIVTIIDKVWRAVALVANTVVAT
ncbi:carboxypeptidase B-like [Aricia agestis]|uniref:carboxypeptidase B-like n=1 Tax=Aricia agestis TaxID=91739 RepID=UPI001C204F0A|nr:carboxypeptidase B-like [Aricia agestis]